MGSQTEYNFKKPDLKRGTHTPELKLEELAATRDICFEIVQLTLILKVPDVPLSSFSSFLSLLICVPDPYRKPIKMYCI